MKLPWTLLLRLLSTLLDVLRRFLIERKRLKDAARKRSLPTSSTSSLGISHGKPTKSSQSSKGTLLVTTTRKFDKIYEEEGRGLPVPFLRALAKRESGSNPKNAKGPAWGLLQVGIDARAGNVLKSYNERMGTAYKPTDMLDPKLNVRVAADLLSRILELYKAEGLEADWTNGNFIGMFAAGWNAGYSRKAGMVKLIRYMKAQNASLTLANAYKLAPESGAGKGFIKRMGQPHRQKWTRSVVSSTFEEQGRPPSLNKKEEGTSWLPLMLALLLLR